MPRSAIGRTRRPWPPRLALAGSIRLQPRRLHECYRIPAGERAVRAQRIDGRVAVSDLPVDYPDRVYLVERHVHVHSYAELHSLADEYALNSQTRGHPAIGSRADASTRRTHASAVQSPSRAV